MASAYHILAGVVRAAVEHNFVPQGAAPAKMWYAEAMFRGERPQKGRLRQFHQVGVEWLGASDPAADAESIIMLMQFFKELGFDTSESFSPTRHWKMALCSESTGIS